MKKIRYWIGGIVVVLGAELMIWGMISGQQMIITMGAINLLAAGSFLGVSYLKHTHTDTHHLYHLRKHYGWTAVVMIWMRFTLHILILQQGMDVFMVWTVAVVVAILLQGAILPLRRGKTPVTLWRVLSVLSMMVVIIVFQEYRTIANPRLFTVAWGVARLTYAAGMVLSDHRSFLDPLFIAGGIIVVIAGIWSSISSLIQANEDRKIETVVYQEKEVYIPAEYCLPAWGNPQMVPMKNVEVK